MQKTSHKTSKKVETLTKDSTQLFFTVKNTAKLLGVHELTIYREFWKGNIPGARKIASKILIPRNFIFTSEKKSS